MNDMSAPESVSEMSNPNSAAVDSFQARRSPVSLRGLPNQIRFFDVASLISERLYDCGAITR